MLESLAVPADEEHRRIGNRRKHGAEHALELEGHIVRIAAKVPDDERPGPLALAGARLRLLRDQQF